MTLFGPFGWRYFIRFIITWSDLQAAIGWTIHNSKSQKILLVIFLDAHLVKFLSLAQFPVDHIGHPIMSTLIILLCLFTAFASLDD